MRDTKTRNTELKIVRKLMEIREIMDKRSPDYSIVSISISKDGVTMFTSDKDGVNYALPNMSLYDSREDGDSFCSYNEADASLHYEDADKIVIQCMDTDDLD